MTLVRIVLSVALGLPASSAAAQAPVSGDMSEKASCSAAAERYAAGQYSEAAVMYEACARSSGDAAFWKKAGMARYSARQYAHAIQALGGYPRATPGESEDAPVVAMLRDAQAHCAVVRFGVTAESTAPRPERLKLVPRDGDAVRDAIEIAWSRSTVALDVWLDAGAWVAELTLPDGTRAGPQDVTVVQGAQGQEVLFTVAAPVVEAVAPPAAVVEAVAVGLAIEPAAARRRGVEVTWTGPRTEGPLRTNAASTTWNLAKGEWTLQVAASRFATETKIVEIGGSMTIAARLRRTREDRARIGLSVATGGVALGLVIGGMVGAIGGGKDYRGALAGLDADRGASLTAALAGVQRSSSGAMLVSSGFGAGIAAASVAAGAGNRLLGVEAGVGTALLITGLALLIPTKRRYLRDAEEMLELGEMQVVDRQYLDEHRRPELAAASLLGLGAGVAAGAIVALVTRAGLRRSSSRRNSAVTTLTTPRTIGLNFEASF